MHDVAQRLTKCFSAVFPELSPEEIVRPTSKTIGDSLTAVTLVAVIQEEFGIELEPDCPLEDLSFEKVMARITKDLDSEIPSTSLRPVTHHVR
jgi:acyl carrier protein